MLYSSIPITNYSKLNISYVRLKNNTPFFNYIANIIILFFFLIGSRMSSFAQYEKCYTDNIIQGQKSKTAPAIIVFRNKLYMLHLGDQSNDLWYSYSEDGKTWSENQRIPNQSSKATPALATFNGKLYMIHLGDQSNDLWYSFSTDGLHWSQNRIIQGQKSKTTPSLVSFQGKLHMIHLGDESNDLWYSYSTDGVNWSANTRIPNQKSKAAPALAVYRNKLHMVHIGDESNDLWHSYSADGIHWSENRRIAKQKSKAAPSLAVYDGGMAMVHLDDESNQIWLSNYLGNEWKGEDWILEDRKSKARPALAGFNLLNMVGNFLHIVHIGDESNNLWHGIVPVFPQKPGTPVFSDIKKRSATVSWQDNSNNEEAFIIETRREPEKNYKPLEYWQEENALIKRGCFPNGKSKEKITRNYPYLAPGGTYWFRIRAQNFGGVQYSEEQSIKTKPHQYPASPSDLKITGTTMHSISIAWKDNSDNESGFKLKWEGTWSGSETINKPNTNSYTITDLYSNVRICITLKAYNEDGESRSSTEEVCGKTIMQPPQDTKGIASILIYNCHQNKKDVIVWTFDRSIQGATWSNHGKLASQYSGSNCPVGDPMVISFEDGHTYRLIAIDCGDAPPDQTNVSCHKLTIDIIKGKSSGETVVQTIN